MQTNVSFAYGSSGSLVISPGLGDVFVLILWSLTIVIGLLGNCLLILTIYSKASLRTAMNAYVLSIGFFDLLTCVGLLPLHLVIQRRYWDGQDIPSYMYSTDVFLRTLTDIGRLLMMQSLSVERYQSIAKPFAVTKIKGKRRAYFLITLQCVISAIVASLSTGLFCNKVLSNHFTHGENYNQAYNDNCHSTTSSELNATTSSSFSSSSSTASNAATSSRNECTASCWGNLENYIELPLTATSVAIIALSYGLILAILREQKRKMRKHAKPKDNKVAPSPTPGGGNKIDAASPVSAWQVYDASKIKTTAPPIPATNDAPDTQTGVHSPDSESVVRTKNEGTNPSTIAPSDTFQPSRLQIGEMVHNSYGNNSSSESNINRSTNLNAPAKEVLKITHSSVKHVRGSNHQLQTIRENEPALSRETTITGESFLSGDVTVNMNNDNRHVSNSDVSRDSQHGKVNLDKSDIDALDSSKSVGTNSNRTSNMPDKCIEKVEVTKGEPSIQQQNTPSDMPKQMDAPNLFPNDLSPSPTRNDKLNVQTDHASLPHSNKDSRPLTYPCAEENKIKTVINSSPAVPAKDEIQDKFEQCIETRGVNMHTKLSAPPVPQQTKIASNVNPYFVPHDSNTQSSQCHRDNEIADLKACFEPFENSSTDNKGLLKSTEQNNDSETSANDLKLSPGSSSEVTVTVKKECQTSTTAPVELKDKDKNLLQVESNEPAPKTGSQGSEMSGETASRKLSVVQVVEMDGTVNLQEVDQSKTMPDSTITGAVCLMNPQNRVLGRRRVELKSALKVGFVLSCFVCLWVPLPVTVTIVKYTSGPHNLMTANTLSVLSALATATAALDPVVYGLLNATIRNVLVANIKTLRMRFHRAFLRP